MTRHSNEFKIRILKTDEEISIVDVTFRGESRSFEIINTDVHAHDVFKIASWANRISGSNKDIADLRAEASTALLDALTPK